MILLLAAFSVLHIVFYLLLTVGWLRIPVRIEKEKSADKFSVIIPIRNEERNILKLLQDLEAQNYPKEAFEVLVVDDFSDDNSAEVVKNFALASRSQIRLIELEDPSSSGKKMAITRGVEEARFPLILTTDADCRLGTSWISSYDGSFQEGTKMVTGPVLLTGSGIFEKLQQIEFAGLMGFGAVSLEYGRPTVCSGANLGFRKDAFELVKGYSDNLFIPSGDDEFLMHSIFSRFPSGLSFLKDRDAIVKTPAKEKLNEFINQRVRWVSKWRFNKNHWVQVLSVAFFSDLILYLSAIVLTAVGKINWEPVAAILVSRIAIDFFFTDAFNSFLKEKTSPVLIVMLQIIYPVHVLLMGVKSIFGSYTWKGRNYR